MKSKFLLLLTLILGLVGQFTIAQEKIVTGTVTDQNGLPFPGVNVVVKNTSYGTQTNYDGEYSITAEVG
ncbi:carboxypeptidase-like regulatory domain-containing protein, partial [Salegentibacter flavus]